MCLLESWKSMMLKRNLWQIYGPGFESPACGIFLFEFMWLSVQKCLNETEQLNEPLSNNKLKTRTVSKERCVHEMFQNIQEDVNYSPEKPFAPGWNCLLGSVHVSAQVSMVWDTLSFFLTSWRNLAENPLSLKVVSLTPLSNRPSLGRLPRFSPGRGQNLGLHASHKEICLGVGPEMLTVQVCGRASPTTLSSPVLFVRLP